MNEIFDRTEYMRKYEREIINIQKLSYRTLEVYSVKLHQLFNWCEEKGFNPIEINNADTIKDFLSRYQSPNTLSQALSALKIFFDDVLGVPLVVRYIKRPKKEKKLPDILSKSDLLKIYQYINCPKQKFIFLLLFSTGLRKSEIQNLEEINFDLFRDLIIIKGAKGKKDRLVPLSPIVKDKFFEYKQYREKEVKKFKFIPQYFFVGQFGGQYKSVNAFLKTAAKKAGVAKRVYQHLIRHCYGTYMREKLVDLATIGQLLGHEEGSKATYIYAQLSNTVLKNAGTPLEDLMAPIDETTKQQQTA